MKPKATHLQAAVLAHLTDGVSGYDLRERLRKFGISNVGPSFYQMMSRLEEAGLIESVVEQTTVGNYKVRETCYWITKDGRLAIDESLSYYENLGKVAFC